MTVAEVRTAAGTVRGASEAGLAVFRGIPFAEPPVGELRFAAPQPVRGWDGVRAATAYGPPPPQSGLFGMDELAQADQGWLTVNVWTPQPTAGAGLPVMVWFQGGGYVFGTSGLPEYDGARLASAGVVLVTFNYRTGIEGFLHIEGAPPNRALLDQLAALEWVRENIQAFGGNPEQVTVFGQSAGAGSIAALLAMPRSKGLFHRAILQSVPGTVFTPDLATDIATAVAAELGLRPTAADLSPVDPLELPAVGDAVMAKIGQWSGRWGLAAHREIPFAPVIDGDLLPLSPWQALAQGAAKEIDLIVGHVRHEQRLFNLITGVLGQVTGEQAAEALSLFAPGPGYRAGYPGASAEELYETVHSDWLFRMPSLHLAEAQVRGGGRTHLFELTWPAPGMDGMLGACHGLDVPLIFGNLDKGQPAMLFGEGPTAEAEELSARMRAAWISFATNGDPGWPAYDLGRRLTQLYDVEPTVTTYPEEPSRLIWRDHTFAALPLITD